jgi:hypothetical protein|tara:strand:+ start:42 stop:221 length:180 start_codon:yes stop_codon:yes gene_type:complete
MDKKRTTEKKEIKYFHEEFPKEEEILRISYEHSKRMREERLNKSPRLDLFDKIQAREKE